MKRGEWLNFKSNWPFVFTEVLAHISLVVSFVYCLIILIRSEFVGPGFKNTF